MTASAMTPEQAEALGEVSAAVLQVLFNASHAHPELDWFDLAMATALAMRGLAVRECHKNPAMSSEKAKFLLIQALAQVMALPDGAIKVDKVNSNTDTSRPDTVGIIPVRRN